MFMPLFSQSQTSFSYWLPRVLTMLFVIFMGFVANAEIDSKYEYPDVLTASALHYIPTAIVAIAGAIAWRKEKLGAFAMVFLGLLYIALGWGSQSIWAFLAVSGPLFLIGAIFLRNDLENKKKLIS
ncbi:MAG: hypothetical protein PHC85_00375 [Candidatus Pacebacteria bacterium]|nr:hypothetical protein [Candidatus Paceibacterota bacterium]